MNTSTKLKQTSTSLTPPRSSRNGYPIHDFDQHFNETESPLQLVSLLGLQVDQRDLISPSEASDALYGIGISSQDRIWHLLANLKRLGGSDSDKVGFFKEHWSGTDDTYEYGGTILYELENLNSSEYFWSYLDKSEKTWMLAVDQCFTVYRGCDEGRIDGISWTTDRSVAEGFARGHRWIRNPNPVVVSATCHQDDVLMALNDREEFEIIVDPSRLGDVWVTPID